MNCSKCGKEMREGFLFTTKDGAFSFADEVPGLMTNAKHAPGFVQITTINAGHRVRIGAYCCEDCRLVQFQY